MDISVIVPVYSVEEYLARCLDSIFSQHFSGLFEVIAVDDATTDRSLHILKSYQRTEPRLVVLTHEENKKLSIARTTGMNAARGDSIMHVDADDRLLSTSYKICIGHAMRQVWTWWFSTTCAKMQEENGFGRKR